MDTLFRLRSRSPGGSAGRMIGALLCCMLALPAAPRDYPLEHLSINEGVSQNTVFCIFQDRRGFMWLGTEDGLYRFDGYRFTGFTHDWRDPQSISHNMISTIFEDRQGQLWIGTNGGGLNRFDHETERFIHFRHTPEDSAALGSDAVSCIYQDRSGNLWIGTGGSGLRRFDPASGRFRAFHDRSGQPSPLANRHVRVMLEDRQGDFWIGTNREGLYRLAQASGRWIHYTHHQADPAGLANNTITSLLETPGGELWIGTDRGLHRYDPHSGRVLLHKAPALAQDIITAIITPDLPENEAEETLWIGTLDGLKIFTPSRGQVTILQQNATDPRGLRTNNILSLFQDRSGIVWIGVENGGINKYDHKKNRFHFLGHRQLGLDDPEEYTIRAILHSRRNGREHLWLGTLGAGLVRYTPANAVSERHIHHPEWPGSISSNNILSLLEDERGDLWIGTWGGGLNRLHPEAEQPGGAIFTHFRHDPQDPATPGSDVIQAIYQAPVTSNAGAGLWIGTDRGLDYFDRDRGRFHHFTHDPGDPASLSDNTIQSNGILIDRRRQLWVGTWNGLNRLDLSTAGDFASGSQAKFIRYLHDPANPNSLSDNRVIALFEDPDSTRQILWVGTHGGGLNRLLLIDGTSGEVKITHYSENDGLPDDVIYGILGDETGNLWLSSNYGISKFNRATRTFSNYDERDGLAMTRFFWGAAHRSRINGEIFFGGREGFVGFDPRDLGGERYIPPIYLTDFQIFNESMPVKQPGSPLTRAIGSSEEIVLTHNQNVFSFEFAVLDYAIPEKNQYTYRMEGFDNGWIFSGRRNFATYTNLNPGSYVFQVKGSNNDGIWSAHAAEVSLHILPPFWKTWWFLLLTGTVLVGAVVMIVTAYVRQLLAVERLRTRLAADLHDDIGSSLTEIAILSEVIAYQLREERRELKKNIQRISRTARELVDRMSDIVWLVNPKRDSLYDLILRLKDNYAEMLTGTDISFRSENLKSLEKVSLSMEHRQHLYLIFKEGINNAITHSGGSEILLNARVQGRRLEMELRDNGRGFESETRREGNGLSNMQARARKIGGELLIETRPGGGTVLRFSGNMR